MKIGMIKTSQLLGACYSFTHKRGYLNTSFGDGDCLLLHGFMNGHLVFGVHLVKLVDAANTIIRQHQRSSFNHKLMRLLILKHSISSVIGVVNISSDVSMAILLGLHLQQLQPSNLGSHVPHAKNKQNSTKQRTLSRQYILQA